MHWVDYPNESITFRTRADLSWPRKNEQPLPPTSPPNENPTMRDIMITRTDTGDSEMRAVVPGKSYNFYYEESNIVYTGLPMVLTNKEILNQLEMRTGLILVEQNLKHRIGTWASTKVHGLAFASKTTIPENELWEFFPGENVGEFAIVNKKRKCLVADSTVVRVENFDFSIDLKDIKIEERQKWIVTSRSHDGTLYTIKSARTNKYLAFSTPETPETVTAGFVNVRTDLISVSSDTETIPPLWKLIGRAQLEPKENISGNESTDGTPDPEETTNFNAAILDEIKSQNNISGIEFTDDTPDPEKTTDLITAIDQEKKEHLVQLLIWDDMISDSKLNEGFICAASKGKVDILKYLAENTGLSVNTTNQEGNTALHEAAKAGQLESVETLLALEGIDPYLRNNNNKLARDLVARGLAENDEIRSRLPRSKLKYGDVITLKNKYMPNKWLTRGNVATLHNGTPIVGGGTWVVTKNYYQESDMSNSLPSYQWIIRSEAGTGDRDFSDPKAGDDLIYGEEIYLQNNYADNFWFRGHTVKNRVYLQNHHISAYEQNTVREVYVLIVRSTPGNGNGSRSHSDPMAGRPVEYGNVISLQSNFRDHFWYYGCKHELGNDIVSQDNRNLPSNIMFSEAYKWIIDEETIADEEPEES